MGRILVIDLEMCKVQFKHTSFHHRHEIVQIGAVLMDEAFEIQKTFMTYVRPKYGKIDYYISSLTGISEKDVKRAPDLADALRNMYRWLGDADVCFYAWSDTDYNQLRNEISEKGLGEEEFAAILDPENWVDYQKIAGERFGVNRSLALSDAIIMAEIEQEGRQHDGLSDAVNTARLISKLEHNPDYHGSIDRLRREEEVSEPLTTSMASLLKGIVLDS